MTEIVAKEERALTAWGTRSEITEYADRIGTMLPNGKDFTRNETLLIGQYCLTMDLNPYRGEVYFYKDWQNKLVAVDGYKALTRWAQAKCPYTDRTENITPAPGELVHVRYWVLRDDRKEQLREFMEMGAKFAEAYELAATYADGIVLVSETKTRKGQDREPPVGWSWEQVARKRALKNALNLSHGAPSPREMAESSWEVNGQATSLEDWQGTETMSNAEAEALAEMRARGREHEQRWQAMTPEEQQVKVEQNSTLLYGPPDFDGFDDEPPPAPKPTNGDSKPKANVARPYPATAIRATCRKRAQWFDGERGPLTSRNVAIGPLDESQMKKVAALMTASLGQMSTEAKDGARHQALHYLFEQASTKALTHLEAQAIIDWLKGETDFTPGPYAEVELAGVLVQAGVDAGQMEMALDVEPPAQEDAPF